VRCAHFETRLTALLSVRKIEDGIKEGPHPEEAVLSLSKGGRLEGRMLVIQYLRR
jgi:hypothetical protein